MILLSQMDSIDGFVAGKQEGFGYNLGKLLAMFFFSQTLRL